MLTLITPTRGRPEAFALLVGWIRAQEWAGPLRWLVCTDGADGYDPPRGCEVVSRTFSPSVNSLPANLLMGLERCGPSDKVLVVEDDDYYAPGYLAAYDAALDGAELVGAPNARYYHVGTGRHQRLGNAYHASLAQTGATGTAIDALRQCCRGYLRPRRRPFIDMALWRSFAGPKHLNPDLAPLHISIKGMPGTEGYGIGHRPTFGQSDHDGSIARSWGVPDAYHTFRGAHDSAPA